MAEQKVLIAVDTSDFAEQAVDYYVKELHLPRNKVIFLYCPELSNLSSTKSPPTYRKMQKKVEEEEKKTASVKAKYEAKAEAGHLSGEFKTVTTHKPGEAIVDTAKEEGVAFIVTGTRGLGKMRRTVMGSVSDYVVHHAPCPVIVCRH